MADSPKIDVALVKVFASAAIRAVKEQCLVEIRVGMPSYKGATFPTAIDVASFIEVSTESFMCSFSLCYPRATFLPMVQAMTGETHKIITAAVRDGASELLNIIFGEVKSTMNAKGARLPMAIPQVLLADAALERLLAQDPAVQVPFETEHGPFFAQIGRPAEVAVVAPLSPVTAIAINATADPNSFPPETRILVVDDMSTMRKVVCRALRGFSYTDITEATDGKQAWDEIAKACGAGRPFGLVLSDWNMPNMTGLELLKKVRNNPAIRGLPFILLTAESEVNQIAMASQAGVSAYILKPFSVDSVAVKLREVYAKIRGLRKAA